jgi:hypothetical protein
MSFGMKPLLLASAMMLLATAGCGGSESTDQTGSSKESEAPPAAGPKPSPAVEKDPPVPGSTAPAREFWGSNGENAMAAHGKEASIVEREQASRKIRAWMRARAAKDYVRDCSYLSRRYRHQLVAEDAVYVSNGEVENCPQALAFFGSAASGDYVNTLAGPIDSLRVAGTQGFALYHGRDGNDWAVPMYKEGGDWWVAATAPVELES